MAACPRVYDVFGDPPQSEVPLMHLGPPTPGYMRFLFWIPPRSIEVDGWRFRFSFVWRRCLYVFLFETRPSVDHVWRRIREALVAAMSRCPILFVGRNGSARCCFDLMFAWEAPYDDMLVLISRMRQLSFYFDRFDDFKWELPKGGWYQHTGLYFSLLVYRPADVPDDPDPFDWTISCESK